MLAQSHADRPAVTFEGHTLTFADIDRAANRLARHLTDLGVAVDDLVTIAEPNSVEFIVAAIACWKVGATPQPVSARLPPLELEAIIELADPVVVIGADRTDRPSLPRGFVVPDDVDAGPLPDARAASWKAPTSGGSTGRPKLIVSGDPSVWTPASDLLASIIGAVDGATMVMPGPLYHNGPFIWAFLSLMAGSHLVLLRRFDAEATLQTIEDHQATAIYTVPTMLQRILKLDDATRLAYDVSSLRTLFHLAEPCPKWVKEAYIDWLGAEVIWELYGGTEGQASTVLDGHAWLEHPGSVGKPISGEIAIWDDDGCVLPAGEVGDVWMRRSPEREEPTYRYIGAEPEERDGWECLGDVGWMDADGYLYLADRRKDMILVGGANVYPAEIEAALNQHPAVRSSAVIGLPSEDKGAHIHAIVESEGFDESELLAFLADRLVTYKLPRSFEIVTEPLRDDAGKVRRGQLLAERS